MMRKSSSSYKMSRGKLLDLICEEACSMKHTSNFWPALILLRVVAVAPSILRLCELFLSKEIMASEKPKSFK